MPSTGPAPPYASKFWIFILRQVRDPLIPYQYGDLCASCKWYCIPDEENYSNDYQRVPTYTICGYIQFSSPRDCTRDFFPAHRLYVPTWIPTTLQDKRNSDFEEYYNLHPSYSYGIELLAEE